MPQFTWSISPYSASNLENGNHAVAAVPALTGAVLYRTLLLNLTQVRTRTSVQVSESGHLEDPLLMYMDHSFKPSTKFEVSNNELRVIATRDIEVGEALSFDYNTTEPRMSCPFFDSESQRWVAGYLTLTPEQRAEISPLSFVLDAAELAFAEADSQVAP